MTVMPARDDAPPPTTEDADHIARALVTHLSRALFSALTTHPPSPGMDALDYSRFLSGELRTMLEATEQRIANLLPPLVTRRGETPTDPLIVAAGGRPYLRRTAREGGYVRTKDGLRRVVEG